MNPDSGAPFRPQLENAPPELLRFQDAFVYLQHWLTEYAFRTLSAFIILVIGWTIAGWVSKGLRQRLHRARRVDATIADYAGSFSRAIILIITIIAVLANFGIQTASLVGVISAATLAVGLAIQGTLTNFAAGVMLLFFRPFKEGDLVHVGDMTGTVRAIGIFAVELRPASGEFILMPNGQVWGTTIINYTRNGTRRLELLIGVDYGVDHKVAQQRALELARAHPQVLSEPPPTAALHALEADAVIIAVRAWTTTSDMSATRLELLAQIKDDFDRHGIEFPSPTRNVMVFRPDDTPAQRPPHVGDRE